MSADLPWDELPDATVVVGADGRLQAANGRARTLLSITDTDLGRPVAEVLPVLVATGENFWECAASWSDYPRRTRSPERVLVLAPDATHGRAREGSIAVSLRWVRSSDGALLRTVAVFRDSRAAERAGRSSADLVSTVAHELRSPLTSVKGFTATLLAKWDRFPDEQKKLMLQTVNSDADRVTRLLTELLDVSRIDAGRLEMRRQVVDVPAAIRKAFDGRIASGESPDRFALSVQGELPEMWLDPDKVDQIVGNLVENSLRHGAGTVRVTVAPSETVPGASIVITDEGAGIPEDVLGRVFTKFWRAGSKRSGTGLGLYIVKGLAEAHGGSVVAGRSADTGGAEFRLLLPAGAASLGARLVPMQGRCRGVGERLWRAPASVDRRAPSRARRRRLRPQASERPATRGTRRGAARRQRGVRRRHQPG